MAEPYHLTQERKDFVQLKSDIEDLEMIWSIDLEKDAEIYTITADERFKSDPKYYKALFDLIKSSGWEMSSNVDKPFFFTVWHNPAFMSGFRIHFMKKTNF
jgi:hypothetical protein